MNLSCFYKAKSKDSRPITFLLLEVIGVEFEADPEASIEDILNSACVFCYGKSHNRDLTALLQDVQKILAGGDSKPEAGDTQTKKRSLGTAYMQWLAKTSPTHLCMLLSEWDVTKATTLYCDTDHSVVTEMAEVYLENEWNRLQASYESSMYGFGGGYKGDSSSDPDTKDLTSSNPSAEKLIKSLGF